MLYYLSESFDIFRLVRAGDVFLREVYFLYYDRYLEGDSVVGTLIYCSMMGRFLGFPHRYSCQVCCSVIVQTYMNIKRYMSNTNRNRGFTLIELLIVVAIIGILAAVVVVTLTGETGNANDSVIKSNLRSVVTSINQAAVNAIAEKNSYNLANACDSTLAESSQMKRIMDSTFPSNYTGGVGGVVGTVRYYVAGVVDDDDDGTLLSESDVKRGSPLANAEIRYGCASSPAGWVLWGRLSKQDGTTHKYFCLDSSGNAGDDTPINSDNAPEHAADFVKPVCATSGDGIGQ